MMSTLTLHYVYDPLCGWCYGAAPLLQAARMLPGLALELHGGGMMAGPNRQPVTAALRSYVLPHDERITAITGQPFGSDYRDGLLNDHSAMFDSEPPITAVLAAENLAGRGIDMLERLQQAHYREGRRIADIDVLIRLAADIGLAGVAFAQEFSRLNGSSTQAHISASRSLLASVGGHGFPTFALDYKGEFTLLDASRHLGRPDSWRQMLSQQLEHAAELAILDAYGCRVDGCPIP